MPSSTAVPLAAQSIGPFTFEDGTTVADAAFTYGIVSPPGVSRGVVIVCPSLTATPSILHDWWTDVGPALSNAHYTTLYPHAFDIRTIATLSRERPPGIRDLARGIMALTQSLGLAPPTFATGGSMGGMLALEVAIVSGAPTHALVVAAPAVQTAWARGWNMIQLSAIEQQGGTAGLMLARAVGMMTYRTEAEFEARFASDATSDGRTIVGYLTHHGQRLVERFDAAEYERRVRAMDTHDVGRGRGGWREALSANASRIRAVGIHGDSLYSAESVVAWASTVGAVVTTMQSIHGHDAFLLEREQMRAAMHAAFTHAVSVTAIGAP